MKNPFQFFIFLRKILYSFHEFSLRLCCTSGVSQIFTFGRSLAWFSILAAVRVLKISTAFAHHNKAANTAALAARMWTTHYLRGSETSWFRHGDRKIFEERKLSELTRIVEIKLSQTFKADLKTFGILETNYIFMETHWSCWGSKSRVWE